MALHHVAQCAGLVVELATPFDTQLLRDRDLHVTDTPAPPQRLEQRVAETQRNQVLHRLFAEVVIDAVDLLLGEYRADTAVDELGGGPVVAQRLLQHDARLGRHEPRGGEVVAGQREETRAPSTGK